MKDDFHPCTFASPLLWMRLAWDNGGIPRPYWRKFAGILALSTATTPLRLAERVAFSRKIDRTPIDKPPFFVLGFPRTGSTHLQYLLAQDPQWGYFDTFQCVAAPFSFVARGWIRRLLEKGMAAAGEQTRPMDNVKVTVDSPQEEDIAVAAMSRLSAMHQLAFPKLFREVVAKYVMMGAGPDGSPDGNLSAQELRQWERVYVREVRKVVLHSGGKPPMLRNTVNIARSDHLGRLFPGAKFLHIVRNPYAVYPSVMHLHRTMLPLYQLDHFDWDEIEQNIVDTYKLAMSRYMRNRKLIPDGHFAEVRYEDLDEDPLGELERVYEELALPGWSVARERIEAYLKTVAGYRKNRFTLPQATIDRITAEWGFAVDAWGYEPPPATE